MPLSYSEHIDYKIEKVEQYDILIYYKYDIIVTLIHFYCQFFMARVN